MWKNPESTSLQSQLVLQANEDLLDITKKYKTYCRETDASKGRYELFYHKVTDFKSYHVTLTLHRAQSTVLVFTTVCLNHLRFSGLGGGGMPVSCQNRS